MNFFVKTMCFLGGANLDILKKCPTEKNGFIAIGIGIVDMALISVLAMYFILTSTIIKNFNTGLIILISLFYGFVIFIGYWGIISVIRKRVKYPFFISMFSFFAISIMSIVLAFAINKIILKIDYSVNLSARSYISIVFCILFSSVIYLIPLILKILINASPYEEEKERLEFNFISQKEADVMAYREKYQGYARYFNDSAIKMESIKQLGDISKEYHMYMENIQNETFDFINKLDKMNQSTNGLLEECKKNAEEQFKITIDKISKIFGSI